MEERLKFPRTPGWSADSLPCPVLAGCLPQSLPRAGSFRAKCRSEQIEGLCNWLFFLWLWLQKCAQSLFCRAILAPPELLSFCLPGCHSQLFLPPGCFWDKRAYISSLHPPPRHFRARPQALCPEDRSGSSPSHSLLSSRGHSVSFRGRCLPLSRPKDVTRVELPFLLRKGVMGQSQDRRIAGF